MRRLFPVLLSFGLVVLIVTGCRTAPRDTITQVSTIDAILAGAYDGQMPLRELLRHGDFGIGTFYGLDGEMVLLDGDVRQVRADGKVYAPQLSLATPFACVVRFTPDIVMPASQGTDFQGLEAMVNKAVPNANIFCAVKLHGRFSAMRARSVPAQKKPYPPLVEVTKHQPVFNLDDIRGTLVGFRSPVFVKGIGVPGYHIHFISDTLDAGGHVLGFTLEQGVVEIDICNRFLMILPEDETALSGVDLDRDRSGELEEAER